jgi:hypothetical protein
MKRASPRTPQRAAPPAASPAEVSTLRARAGVLAAVAFAIALRVAFAAAYFAHPVGAIVPLDTEPYRQLARAVAAGDYRDPAFEYLNPPYAFLLAPLVQRPPEEERRAVAALQIAMDAVIVLLVAYVGRRAFAPATGTMAAFAYAVYGTAVFYTATELPVTLSVLGLIVTVASALFALSRPAPAWLLPGTALGLFALVRPNALLLLPVLLLWAAVHGRRSGGAPWRAAAAYVVAGLIATLAPFAIRSWHVTGRPSPFPVNGGINFYIGNGPEANGRYAHVPRVADRPGEQVQTSIEEASRRTGRPLDASQASSFWYRAALGWMARTPEAAVRLMLRKAAMFFRAEEAALNISYAFARRHLPLLWPCLGFGVLMPLALWGAIAGWRSGEARRPAWRLLMAAVAVYAGSVVAFFISDRYRMPVVPLLAVLAAHGLQTVVAAVRGRRRAEALVAAGVVAAGAFLVDYPFEALRYQEDGSDHVKLADVYTRRGQYAQALDECRQASAAAPGEPETSFCFANTYYFEKDYFRAEMALRATLERGRAADFDLPARRNLIWLLKEQGLYDDARRLSDDDAERADIESRRREWLASLASAPDYAAAQVLAAQKEYAEGRVPEARYDFKRAIVAAPDRAEAYVGWARAARDLQLRDEACEAMTQALALSAGAPELAAERASLCP